MATTNVVRHHRRSRLRYESLIARLPPPEPAAGPEERIENQDVLAALRRLGLNDQRVLTLCVLEGYSERAAAAALGVPAGTVKSRLHRAKRHLATALGRHAHPSREREIHHDA